MSASAIPDPTAPDTRFIMPPCDVIIEEYERIGAMNLHRKGVVRDTKLCAYFPTVDKRGMASSTSRGLSQKEINFQKTLMPSVSTLHLVFFPFFIKFYGI